MRRPIAAIVLASAPAAADITVIGVDRVVLARVSILGDLTESIKNGPFDGSWTDFVSLDVHSPEGGQAQAYAKQEESQWDERSIYGYGEATAAVTQGQTPDIDGAGSASAYSVTFTIDRRHRYTLDGRLYARSGTSYVGIFPIGGDWIVLFQEYMEGQSTFEHVGELPAGTWTFAALSNDGTAGVPPSAAAYWEVLANFVLACPPDINDDGVLNIFDFLDFQTAYSSETPLGDFNGDGQFTVFDFLGFQTAYSNGC